MSKKEYFTAFTTFSSQHLKDVETSIAKQVKSFENKTLAVTKIPQQ